MRLASALIPPARAAGPVATSSPRAPRVSLDRRRPRRSRSRRVPLPPSRLPPLPSSPPSRAIVESLASHGAIVHTCARTSSDVDSAVREWTSRGWRVSGAVCDVSDAASRASLVAGQRRGGFGGRVDILVSNVGFNIRKPTVDFTEAEYAALMNTNLASAFELCKAFHPLLAAAGTRPSSSTPPSRRSSPCRAARCTP